MGFAQLFSYFPIGSKKKCTNTDWSTHKPAKESYAKELHHHYDVTIEDGSDNEDHHHSSPLSKNDFVKTVITPTEFISELSDTPSLASDIASSLNPYDDSLTFPNNFTNTLLTPEGFQSARATSIDTSPTPMPMVTSSLAMAAQGSPNSKTPQGKRSIGTSTSESPANRTADTVRDPSMNRQSGIGCTGKGCGAKSTRTAPDYGSKPSGSTETGYGTRSAANAENCTRPSTNTGYNTGPSASRGYDTKPSASGGYSAKPSASTGYGSRSAGIDWDTRPSASTDCDTIKPLPSTGYGTKPSPSIGFGTRRLANEDCDTIKPSASTNYGTKPSPSIDCGTTRSANADCDTVKPSASTRRPVNAECDTIKPSASTTRFANADCDTVKPSASTRRPVNAECDTIKPSASTTRFANADCDTVKPSASTRRPANADCDTIKPSASTGYGTRPSANADCDTIKPSANTGYGTRPSPSTGYGTRPSPGTGYGTRPSTGTGYGTRPSPGAGYGAGPSSTSYGTRTTARISTAAPTNSDGSKCYFYEPKFDQAMTAKERSYLKYKYGTTTNKPRREYTSYSRQTPPNVTGNKTSQLRFAFSRHMTFTNRSIHLNPILPESLGRYVPKKVFGDLRISKPRPAPKDEANSVAFRNNRTTKLRYMYNHLPTDLRRRVREFDNLPIEQLSQPYSSKDPKTGEMNYVIEGIRYEPLNEPAPPPAPEPKSVTTTIEALEPPKESVESPSPPAPAPIRHPTRQSVYQRTPVISDKRARELRLREKRETRMKRLRRLRLPFRA